MGLFGNKKATRRAFGGVKGDNVKKILGNNIQENALVRNMGGRWTDSNAIEQMGDINPPRPRHKQKMKTQRRKKPAKAKPKRASIKKKKAGNPFGPPKKRGRKYR